VRRKEEFIMPESRKTLTEKLHERMENEGFRIKMEDAGFTFKGEKPAAHQKRGNELKFKHQQLVDALTRDEHRIRGELFYIKALADDDPNAEIGLVCGKTFPKLFPRVFPSSRPNAVDTKGNVPAWTPPALDNLLSEIKRYLGIENRTISRCNDVLNDTIPEGNRFPDRATRMVSSVQRNGAVREHVLDSADGKCEYCGELGFFCENGRRYLEAHHILALANQGSDTVDNVIALCPKHHREAHHGKNSEILKEKFTAIVLTRDSRCSRLSTPNS
jgi:5-methylcytosine-specific restriction endonuclease McrA